MVQVYTGAPGSGKSLHMARDICGYIKRGKKVICNTEIILPGKLADKEHNLFCMENKAITPAFLWEFAAKNHEPRKMNQTLVVIDECQLKFSQTFMTKMNAKLWLEFFSQHRKVGYNILLVTPSARSGIVREIRDNMEMETTHLDLSRYPAKSIIISLVLLLIQLLPINVFMSIGKWRGLQEKKYLIRHLFLYRAKYGRMYDTFKIHEGSITWKPTPPPVEAPPVVIDADLLNPPDSLTWSAGSDDVS